MDMSSSARLPVELYEDILTIAAWAASESDKPWLCALAVTSRRVLAIVRRALYHTVCITTTPHVLRILEAAPSGHFALTRHLWVELSPDEWHAHDLASFFPNVEHLTAGLLFLENAPHVFRPSRLTLRTRLWQDDWLRLSARSLPPALRGLTHLRLAINAYYGLPVEALKVSLTLSPALALQYIVLESATPGWNPARLLTVVLPFFLSSGGLKRLLFCGTPHARYMLDAFALLETYAAEHRERRLWWLDAPTDGKTLSQYRPGVTFDEAQWTAGRPVYTGWPE